jgi:hypothetical protein
MQGGDVLLVATKIAEYGHACLESHAAPDNHDRRWGTGEASPDHGSHGLTRISHDSGLIRVNPRNLWRRIVASRLQACNSDQIIQLQLRASAFPRGLKLLLHKASIVFLALGLERLLQPEQRTRVARVVV